MLAHFVTMLLDETDAGMVLQPAEEAFHVDDGQKREVSAQWLETALLMAACRGAWTADHL